MKDELATATNAVATSNREAAALRRLLLLGAGISQKKGGVRKRDRRERASQVRWGNEGASVARGAAEEDEGEVDRRKKKKER